MPACCRCRLSHAPCHMPSRAPVCCENATRWALRKCSEPAVRLGSVSVWFGNPPKMTRLLHIWHGFLRLVVRAPDYHSLLALPEASKCQQIPLVRVRVLSDQTLLSLTPCPKPFALPRPFKAIVDRAEEEEPDFGVALAHAARTLPA